MQRVKQGFESVRNGLEKNKVFFEIFAAIGLTTMSILVSVYAASLTNYQNTLLHNEALPQFVIEEVQLIDPKTHFATDNQIKIYNFGKIVHDFSVTTAVFIRPDNPRIHFRNGRIPLVGYFGITQIIPAGQQLIASIGGFNNNLLFIKLADVFLQKTNSVLDLDAYFQLSYIDSLGDKHTDYYQLTFEEGAKIDDRQGGQAMYDYFEDTDPLVLETATYANLAKYMT